MTKAPRNIGASARARLLNLARQRGEDFQLVLTRYANERFLYRLANSPHASSFVLKGAALFTVWTGQPHRATRDIDLLGFKEPTENHMRSVIKDILAAKVEDDGVHFEASSLQVQPIRGLQDYGGLSHTTKPAGCHMRKGETRDSVPTTGARASRPADHPTPYDKARLRAHGGGGGIRTHGSREGTPVFKTGAFDHSATPPA